MILPFLFFWNCLIVGVVLFRFSYFCVGKAKYNNHVLFYIQNSISFYGSKRNDVPVKYISDKKRIYLLSNKLNIKENEGLVKKKLLKFDGNSSECNVCSDCNVCNNDGDCSNDGDCNNDCDYINGGYKKESQKCVECTKERICYCYKKTKKNYLKKLLKGKDTIYGLSSGNINVHSAIGIIRISGELSILILEILLARNVPKGEKKEKEKEKEKEEKKEKDRIKQSYKKKEHYNIRDVIKLQKNWESRKIYMGELFDNDNNFIDKVLFAIYKKPNSYTGEDVVEIFCHGNPFIIKEIMENINKLNITFNNILKRENRKEPLTLSIDYENTRNFENSDVENRHENYSIRERMAFYAKSDEQYRNQHNDQHKVEYEKVRKDKSFFAIPRRNIVFTKIRECYKGEFTKRSFENNKMNILEVEGLRELLFCKQKIHKEIAVNYFNGKVTNMYKKLKKNVEKLLMYSQFIIDFEDEHTSNEKERKKINEYFHKQLNSIVKQIQQIVTKKNIETISNSQNILLLGNVNSGKSTFINCIANHDVSIVTNIKGSTIDIIPKNIYINKNMYNFCDSAGVTDGFVQKLISTSLRKERIDKSNTHKMLELMGIKKTLKYLKNRSTACLVLLNVKNYTKEIKNVIHLFNHFFGKRKLSQKKIPEIFISINKCDLLECPDMYEDIENKVKTILHKYLHTNIQKKINKLFFISAKKGYNVNQLLQYINKKMTKNMSLKKSEGDSHNFSNDNGEARTQAQTQTQIQTQTQTQTQTQIQTQAQVPDEVKNEDSGSSMYFLPFERHKLYLKKALSHLLFVKKNFHFVTFDIVSEELKLALKAMNHILGKVKSEKVFNKIFDTFCIGK